MKARELIEELKKINPEAEVVIDVFQLEYYLDVKNFETNNLEQGVIVADERDFEIDEEKLAEFEDMQREANQNSLPDREDEI